MNVLAAWASQGFVVAAPLFPLSNGNVPGGPDAGDVVNQPKDMSYVISAVLADSLSPSGALSGLVDTKEIGAAGHSNGAVTTLGLVANTCCYDSRVKASVVMAGTTEGFPPGHYELAKSPPLLLVHGTADQLIPYRSAPLIYNQAQGPKGLLTIVGGSHDAAGGQDPQSASTVIRTTTDFFERYLTGNRQAGSRLATDGRSPTTKITLELTPGSRGVTIAVPAVPVVHLRASVSPSHDLTSGEAVNVQWSGFTAGKVINILECSHVDIAAGSSAGCTFANAGLLHPDPTGHGQFTMHIITGPVGNGVCDSSHPCSIAVNNAERADSLKHEDPSDLFRTYQGLSKKPEPDIFMRLFERFGLTSKTTLMIDDTRENLDNGQQAGHADPPFQVIPSTPETTRGRRDPPTISHVALEGHFGTHRKSETSVQIYEPSVPPNRFTLSDLLPGSGGCGTYVRKSEHRTGLTGTTAPNGRDGLSDGCNSGRTAAIPDGGAGRPVVAGPTGRAPSGPSGPDLGPTGRRCPRLDLPRALGRRSPARCRAPRPGRPRGRQGPPARGQLARGCSWTGWPCATVGAVGVTTNTKSVAEEVAWFAEKAQCVAAITQPELRRGGGRRRIGRGLGGRDPGRDGGEAAGLTDGRFDDFHTGCSAIPDWPGRDGDPMSRTASCSRPARRPSPRVLSTLMPTRSGPAGPSPNIDLGAEDRYLVYTPFFHVNAQTWSVLPVLGMGATAVLCPSGRRAASGRRCPPRITHFSLMPFSMATLMAPDRPATTLRVGVFGLIVPNAVACSAARCTWPTA